MSDSCLFCKIIKGDIPAKKIYENENVFAIEDIHPQAKVHLLFLHKKHTVNVNEMSKNPSSIGHIFSAIEAYTKSLDLADKGFRVVTNIGSDGGQSVFHTHFHVLGGEPLGHFGRR